MVTVQWASECFTQWEMPSQFNKGKVLPYPDSVYTVFHVWLASEYYFSLMHQICFKFFVLWIFFVGKEAIRTFVSPQETTETD
jgi:hypothetical protein